ncbi:MAG: LCP family protein [Bacilli bacterium]|nr:LCP family protein [Bacilli bacterium]
MNREKKNLLLIIKIVLTGILLIVFSFFTFQILKLNVLPIKYLCIGFGVFILLFIFLMFFLYKIRNKIINFISIILLLIISIILLVGIKYIISTYSFIENIKAGYDTLSYSVLVLNNNEFSNLEDLRDKTILYLENGYQEEIKKQLKEKMIYQESLNEELGSVLNSLLNREVQAIVLEESYITIAKDEIENFEDKIKIVYSFEIIEKAYIESEINENHIEVITKPFILYISGIDQWGNVNSVRGRSDVNQLAVINPITHHILLVNTPRDYYVQLNGTKGLKDKLTHAGIYGIEKSIRTLEDLYETDIAHYLRVNFNTVVQLVDVIGGIEVYSDKAFKPRNDKRFIEKGWNTFDGKLALAYARERFAYTTGDHHRGANQQQVITAIIEKVTKSNILISKYNSILNTLNGSFQTDMSMNEITSFIKYQLDKMPIWKIESIAVTGSGSMNYTYSMGSNYKLYVMEPDMRSVNIAKQKIEEILNEK